MLTAAFLAGVSVALISYLFVRNFIFSSGQATLESRMGTSGLDALFLKPENILKKGERVSEIEAFKQLLIQHGIADKIALLLKTSKYKISVSVFLLICIVVSLLTFSFFYVTVRGFFVPMLLALFFGLTPLLYLIYRRRRYLKKFGEVLPDALSALSSSIRAGRSLESAIDVVAQTAPYPAREEFETVRGEVKFGVPIERALENLYERIRNPELKILVTGISIHRELGGNLSEILDNLERTIRERFAIIREIDTLSSQGRYSAWVLFAVPLALMFIYSKSDPITFTRFIQSDLGSKMIWLTIILDVLGLLWIRRLVRLHD